MSFGRLFLRDVRSLVGFIFTPIGGIVLVIGVVWLNTQIRLARHGVETQAVVKDKHVSSSRDSEGKTSYSYKVLYEFKTAGGKAFTSDQSIGKPLYNRTAIGDTIIILYDPANPDSNAVKADRSRLIGPVLFTALGGIFTVIGLALLLASWRSASRITTILKRGIEAVGRITSIRRNTSYEVNGRHVFFIIEYEFEDHSHIKRRGSNPLVHEKMIEPLALGEGTEIPIKFLTRDPGQSTVDLDALRSLAQGAVASKA